METIKPVNTDSTIVSSQQEPTMIIKEIVREVGAPGLGSDDLNDMISPLQR